MAVPIEEVNEFYQRWNNVSGNSVDINAFFSRIATITYDVIGQQNWCKIYLNVATYLGVYSSMLSHGSVPGYICNKMEKDVFNGCKFIQCVIWAMQDNQLTKFPTYFSEYKKILNLSNVPVQFFKKESGYYGLYPAGAKILDDEVINKTLLWLNDYPTALKDFSKALEHYAELDIKPQMARNVLDDMRASFENFLKRLLENEKSIEHQYQEIGSWLKQKGVANEIKKLYTDMIMQNYALFQNEKVKHSGNSGASPDKDKLHEFSKAEVEYIIYQTGIFIRFLIQLKNEVAETGV